MEEAFNDPLHLWRDPPAPNAGRARSLLRRVGFDRGGCLSGRRSERRTGPKSTTPRRARRRGGLSHSLPIDRAEWRADRRLRHGRHSSGRSAAGRAADRRLGPSDHRRRPALRPVARQGALSDDPGPPRHGGARLCRHGDRLSRPRHAADASLSRRGQRRTRGARFCAGRSSVARRAGKLSFRGLGTFARRAGGALHRFAG